MNPRYLRPLLLAPLVTVALLVACGDDDGGGKPGGTLILATTTSTRDSGLLDVLVPIFEAETGTEVKVIAVGTGAALEMAATGDADAVLVHAPASERKYVERGDLVNGELVMHNDFVVVGPPSDPAAVMAASAFELALKQIARTGPFVSRGDDSGTHKKELELWQSAGIDPASVKQREETGQGMGATLQVASQKRAYTLTDRATFLALEANLDLVILVEGPARLLNIYHAYVVNPEKHTKVNRAQAEAFVAFLVSKRAQEEIGKFGVDDYGEPLFVPDAGKSMESLGRGD